MLSIPCNALLAVKPWGWLHKQAGVRQTQANAPWNISWEPPGVYKEVRPNTRPCCLLSIRSFVPIALSWRSYWKTKRPRSMGSASLRTSRASPCSRHQGSNPPSSRRWWTCCRWGLCPPNKGPGGAESSGKGSGRAGRVWTRG